MNNGSVMQTIALHDLSHVTGGCQAQQAQPADQSAQQSGAPAAGGDVMSGIQQLLGFFQSDGFKQLLGGLQSLIGGAGQQQGGAEQQPAQSPPQ